MDGMRCTPGALQKEEERWKRASFLKKEAKNL
jgi:hypothetical protein